MARKRAGSRLEDWRKRRGLSQEDVAYATGISRSTYSRLERGLIDNPPLRYLVNCAFVFDCNYTDLVETRWQQWAVFDARKAAPPDVDRLWRWRES